MKNTTDFFIDNYSEDSFEVFIEPECIVVGLNQGDRITVRQSYTNTALTVRINKDSGGKTVIALWPGDGDFQVERDGRNVLEGL